MDEPRQRCALVTGIGGQDGSYLAELLLDEGVRVVGVDRPGRERPSDNLRQIASRIELVDADLVDPASVLACLDQVRPHEVYHLASASFVPASWSEPVAVAEFAAVGTTALLEGIRAVDPSIRFFQAASAEVFGHPTEWPQTERTPIAPVTPYGAAKAYSLFLTRTYRLRYGLHASAGILYNHESPRRPVAFVTRKIAHAAAAIKLGLQADLELGNLDSQRDWAYAGDVVRAMRLIVRADEPGDYVVATGECHSVRDVVELAFSRLGLDWRAHVRVDPSLVRGGDPPRLLGDPTLARERLGWHPLVSFEELVAMMVDADLARLAPTAGR
ncbi:MAG: GDP-mannose 4,6-dehydratase [Thermoleophilia bacterium]